MVNPESADHLLEELIRERLSLMEGDRPREIEGWMRSTARKHWIRTGPATEVSESRARDLTKERPWVMSAFQAGNLVELSLGGPQRQEMMEIIDALMGLPDLRLGRLSYEQALTKAKDWHERLVASQALEEDPEGIVEFRAMAEGWRWVEVRSRKALNREGAMLKHCVGSYAEAVEKGRCRIYSLRDPSNKPKLTIEAIEEKASGEPASKPEEVKRVRWAQVRGFANELPSLEMAPALRELEAQWKSMSVELAGGSDLIETGMIIRKGKLTLIEELEAGTELEGWMRFRRRMPKNLSHLKFRDPVIIIDALIEEPLRIQSKEVELKNCRGGELRVEAPERLTVSGVQGFEAISVSAKKVSVDGRKKGSKSWDQDAGLDQPWEGVLTLIGEDRPLKSMEIQGDSVVVIGVRAKKTKVILSETPVIVSGRQEHGLVMERCDLGEMEAPMNRAALTHCRWGDEDRIRSELGEQSFQGASEGMGIAEERVKRQWEDEYLERWAQNARKSPGEKLQEKIEAWKVLVGAMGAIKVVGIGEWEGGSLSVSEGAIWGFSRNRVEARVREQEEKARERIQEWRSSERSDWIKALKGEWDPGKAAAWKEGESLAGKRFAMSQWRDQFERSCPELASKMKRAEKGWEKEFAENEKAQRLIGELAWARWEGEASGLVGWWEKQWKLQGKAAPGITASAEEQALAEQGAEDVRKFGPWMRARYWLGALAPKKAGVQEGEDPREWSLIGEASDLARAIRDLDKASAGGNDDFGNTRGQAGQEREKALFARAMLLTKGWEVTMCAKPEAPKGPWLAGDEGWPWGETLISVAFGARLASEAGLGPEQAGRIAQELIEAIQERDDVRWKERWKVERQKEWAMELARSHEAIPMRKIGEMSGLIQRIAKKKGISEKEWIETWDEQGAFQEMTQQNPMEEVNIEALRRSVEILCGEGSMALQAIGSIKREPAQDSKSEAIKEPNDEEWALKRFERLGPWRTIAEKEAVVKALEPWMEKSWSGKDGFSKLENSLPVEEMKWLSMSLRKDDAYTFGLVWDQLERVRMRRWMNLSPIKALASIFKSEQEMLEWAGAWEGEPKERQRLTSQLIEARASMEGGACLQARVREGVEKELARQALAGVDKIDPEKIKEEAGEEMIRLCDWSREVKKAIVRELSKEEGFSGYRSQILIDVATRQHRGTLRMMER